MYVMCVCMYIQFSVCEVGVVVGVGGRVMI